MRLRSLFFAAALVVLAATAPADQSAMSRADVEEGLTCQCGCGLTVHACNHLQCSFAIPVRKDIAESMDRGETGEQILARYKDKYGEKVLSSPIPTGFNLLAWIGPYVAVAIGAVLIVFAIRRMSSSGPSDTGTPPPAGAGPLDPGDERRRARLREEVEELER